MVVRIVTDSASDLPQEACDELGIEIVPLTIRFGDKEYVDRKELSTADFWRELEKSAVLPETAARRWAFEETFRQLADSGADGICINLPRSCPRRCNPQLASALDGLCLITIVDSKSAPMGIGNLVPEPRDADGADLPTIVADVEDRRFHQRALAAPTRLSTCAGGRIGGARRCSARCCRSNRSSGRRRRRRRSGKVRTRSKALRFIDRVPEHGVEQIALHAGAPDVDEFLVLRLRVRRPDRRRQHRRAHRPPRPTRLIEAG
jgi:DegV family protein with EDD domain